MIGEAQVVINLDEQIREPNRAHLLGQPSPQVIQPCLRRGVQRLGGIRRQVPAAFIHRGVAVAGRGVAVAGRRLEEEVVGRIQPLRQMIGDVLGVGGQAGPLEERLPERLPAFVREEVGVTPRNGKNCTLSVAVFEEMTNRGPADAHSPGDLPLADALLR